MTPDFEQSLLDSLPDAVVTIDRDSTILFANATALTLFGFPRDEFVGRTLTGTIIPPELRAQHERGLKKFLETGAGPVIGRRIDISAIDRSGRRFPIELSVFLDAARPRERFHATMRDTSDRMAREAVSTAERERLRQILDATADAWWEHVVGGGTRFSEAAVQVLGVSIASLAECDLPTLPIIHLEDRVRMRESWHAHMGGETGRFECTVRLVASDQSIRWARLRGRAVEFERGRPSRVLGTIADVTEQQTADERMRNAQRLEMIGLLAGGFAHDLNNLLAAIRGHAALAATEPGASATSVESLAAIQLAPTRAKMLTANMLSLGTPRTEELARFPVVPAIQETLEILRASMPRAVAVSAELGSAQGLGVELDPGAFQQALVNLLLNARDAMPSGGRLRIEAVPVQSDELGLSVRITVEDTGVGIPPEVLGRVFDPFFTTKPLGIGTGLGLAVVQRVVTTAGGTVSVSSDLGRGSCFSILLPAHRIECGATLAGPDSLARTVLLVESHPVLRPMLAEVLRSAGHAVVECEGSMEALRLARERAHGPAASRIQVLVSEHGIGGAPGALSGPRLHSQLESECGITLPAVFMCSDQSRPSFGGRRDVALLQKPFEIGDFVSTLAAVTLGSKPSP